MFLRKDFRECVLFLTKRYAKKDHQHQYGSFITTGNKGYYIPYEEKMIQDFVAMFAECSFIKYIVSQ